ncbi:MAG: thioesterase domain-containing protein [Lachnospiraceae bacterium]|nr:thioesterase domain-containing protein [Lachnospiraceae bacterium]MCM1231348.1 thioesterase domain-containing protein [Ruminococcus flavefaciens]
MNINEIAKKFIDGELNENAEVYLFCFVHSGNWPRIFDRFTVKLEENICVIPLNFPGKSERMEEKPYDDMEIMAKSAAYFINKISGDKRVVFWGDELGAVCSFRTAQLMKRDFGKEPERLIVGGIVPPQLVKANSENLHKLSDEDFVAYVRGVENKPPCVVRFVNDDEMMELILESIKADFKAMETYEYDSSVKLSCPVNVIYGTKEEDLATVEHWKEVTTGETVFRAFDSVKMVLQNLDMTEPVSEYVNDVINKR